MYPEGIVIPMKEELTENGFTELLSSTEVESQLTKEGTTLVMINSVCGCSAGTARPGVLMAVAVVGFSLAVARWRSLESAPDAISTIFTSDSFV